MWRLRDILYVSLRLRKLYNLFTALNEQIRSTPANTTAGLMLGQRRRRWPNIKPVLVKRIVSAGISSRLSLRVEKTS